MNEKKSLLRSTSLVSVNRIISSILGFTRDMLWTRIFGATSSFDAFVIAFHLPSFISFVITEAGLTQAFTPVLSENQTKQNISEIRQFISHACALLLLGLVLIVIFSVTFSSGIIHLFAPGIRDMSLAVSLFQIMATGILFTTLAALCSAILNTLGNYGTPSAMPIVFNGVVIISTIFLTTFFKTPIYVIAWAILFSGIVQLLMQLPLLHKKQLLVKPVFSIKDADVRKMVKLMLPALLSVSVMQTGVLVDFMFSSRLPVGSITWLYYSARLMELPVGVIAIGIATVVLPHLARNHAAQDHENYNHSLNWAIRLSLFFGIPASVGLFVLATPIVATLFGHGLFSPHDVVMSAKSTQAFAIGIVGFMLTRICASGFYAKQNTKLPVKASFIALLINIILNFVLVSRLAHAGLALATSVSGLVNAAILLTALIKKKYYYPSSTVLNFIYKIVASTVIMTTTLYLISSDTHTWLYSNLSWQIEHLFLSMIIAIFIYCFSMIVLFGCRFSVFRRNVGKSLLLNERLNN